MKISAVPLAFVSLLFGLASSGSAQSTNQGQALAGKYYAEAIFDSKASINTIEFLPDGKCVVTFGDKADQIPGSYQGIVDGKLTIEYGNPKIVRSFKAAMVKRVLQLSETADDESYFVLQPDPPWPTADHLLGTYSVQRDEGSYVANEVYTRSPDHTVEVLFRMLSKENPVYREFHFKAQWTYADGIAAYKLLESDLPDEARWALSRDFISKRDSEGIWSIDTNTGDYSCEIPAAKLELPPPPPGFHIGK